MSRELDVRITIMKHNEKKAQDIFFAINEEWPCDQEETWDATAANEAWLYCGGVADCSYSLTTKALLDRIRKAVWKANGGYCEVDIEVSKQSDGDEYSSSEEDYNRLMSAER